jgi:sensory rhodopsin
MPTITTWFALGAVGMALGTLALASGFRVVPEENRPRYAILVAVPLIAVGAYALMALGISGVRTGTGSTVYALRYVDWLLTTPLHVLYLGLLAGAAMGVVYRAIGLMAATIVLGFAGAMLAPPLKWPLFLAGSAAFAGVVYYTVRDFEAAAVESNATTAAIFRKLRAFLVVLWVIYPVIWLLSPVGFDLMNTTTATLVTAYIDVIAKVGFGLIALSGQLTSTAATTESASPAD